MQISIKTKLDVSSYMATHFNNKGSAGYIYTRRMLEYLLEKYKQEGFIASAKISILMRETNLKVSYGACQRAIKYFIDLEGFTGNASDFLIDTLEKIINENNAQALYDEGAF